MSHRHILIVSHWLESGAGARGQTQVLRWGMQCPPDRCYYRDLAVTGWMEREWGGVRKTGTQNALHSTGQDLVCKQQKEDAFPGQYLVVILPNQERQVYS